MRISVGTRIIAEGQVQAVALRPVVGAYELIFLLNMMVHASAGHPRHASVRGAEVRVRAGGTQEALGFARPQRPFEVTTRPSSTSLTADLVLPLQPGQLAGIETLRGAADLAFSLTLTGIGVDQDSAYQPMQETMQERWDVQVPRSDWIEKLRQAGARNVVLIEVPVPVGESDRSDAIATHLQRAEAQFRNGDYRDCVATCRTVIQELGHERFQEKAWFAPLLARFAADRDGMTKDEREAAMWAAARHYTHQAHHGESEGGIPDYSRAEAEFVLSLTASFARRERAG